MAESGGATTKKRHKPIEPPSPETLPQQLQQSSSSSGRVKASVFERLGGSVHPSQPKRPNACINWSKTGFCPRQNACPYAHGDEEAATRHDFNDQQPPPPPRYPRAYPTGSEMEVDESGVERAKSYARTHSRSQQPFDSRYDRPSPIQEAPRDRFPGGVDEAEISDHESSKLRSKAVVVTKAKGQPPDGNGNSRRPGTSGSREEGSQGDNQESEEALNRRLKDIKRQLKELDKHQDVNAALVTGNGTPGHRVSNQSQTGRDTKYATDRNGVIDQKRYRNDDHQKSHHPSMGASTSPSRHSSSRRQEERPPFVDRGHHHQDTSSVKSYGSSSRRHESPHGSSKPLNGERIRPHERREDERRRTPPMMELPSGSRSGRLSGMDSHQYPRDSFRAHHLGASGSASTTYPRRDDYPRSGAPSSSSSTHRHEFQQPSRTADYRRSQPVRPDELRSRGEPERGSESRHADLSGRHHTDSRPPPPPIPQHHELNRRAPDRYFESTDDRGNHSKSRTSNYDSHPSERDRHSRRPDSRTETKSTSSTAAVTKSTSTSNRHRGHSSEARHESGSRPHSSASSDRHRRPDHDSAADRRNTKRSLDERHESSSKRSKYDDGREKRRTDRGGGSPRRSSSSNSIVKPEVKMENGSDAIEDGHTTLVDQCGELEPISDEEMEESSGNEAANEPREIGTMEKALSVEWSEALSVAKPSGAQRFRLDYFVPALAATVDYLDERTLDEAGGQAAIHRHQASNRWRLLAYSSPALAARADLKLRRQLSGLVPEVDVGNHSLELNTPLNAREFGKALESFDKWTLDDEQAADGDS